MPIILEEISKEYRDAERSLRVLDDVSFSFEDGQTYSVMGRSGVGKTTLLQIIGALDRPTSGKIIFHGEDIAHLSSNRAAEFRAYEVGFVFQFHQLLGEFTAWENVAMPLFVRGAGDEEARMRAMELLSRVGLADRAFHRPGELSGGEQQRVSLARALVHRPRLLLADEPTGNLDLATAEAIRAVISELQREYRFTLIAVTHNPEFASHMAVQLRMEQGGALIPLR